MLSESSRLSIRNTFGTPSRSIAPFTGKLLVLQRSGAKGFAPSKIVLPFIWMRTRQAAGALSSRPAMSSSESPFKG